MSICASPLSNSVRELIALAQARPARGFIWSVERDGRTSWLVGSLHVLTKDSYPLPVAMDQAFGRAKTLMEETDVLVTIDLRRYDRWLVEAARTAAKAGVWTVSIADSVLSPVAACAQRDSRDTL